MKVLLLLLLSFSFCYGDVMDHLRKIEGKSSEHQMRNIDFIYMINLDRRPEKYAMSCSQLHPYGIYPYRFSAVDGKALTLDVINDVGLKYKPGMSSLFATCYPIEAEGKQSHGFMKEFGMTYFVHTMATGPIAISLSHISVLKDAWDSGYETIWVMEDDISVVQDPNLLSDLIQKLDTTVGQENWDVLFTSQEYIAGNGCYLPAYGTAKRPDMDCRYEERYSKKYVQVERISHDFKKIGARFGAQSMIIRRSGIKKLLDFWKEHQIYLPYDMENHLPPGIKRYSLCYDVVANIADSISDNGF
jgi:GR25 family glycosyltransferase involved in LPS biosynthesis